MIYEKRAFKKIPKFLFKIYSKKLIKSYKRYQPVFYDGQLIEIADRDCIDRWNLIKKEIINYEVKTLVDLGCAEGFYVLQSAKEFNCFSLGIDADFSRIAIAQNQIISERIVPAGFMFAIMDEDFLDKLPQFDLIVFMSVMHHIMYTYGEDYSRKILNKIRKKTKKCMIFEMGQSNETKNGWSKSLPDMGDNPHQWIKNFILSTGFSKVEKIGESSSYKKDQKRAIFKAIP
ncbi:class I SAM-dependent methyltransferase [bacterium]|nr:class I SAM-dependent methyltransferase [bacterium]